MCFAGGAICPANELQAWAHCAAFAQKLTIDVADPSVKASGASSAIPPVFLGAFAVLSHLFNN
jgi:hypothetical protein